MKFDVIVADPPQQFKMKRTGGNLLAGAEQQYQLMSDEEIITLPVEQIAKDDAYLFLWCSDARVAEGLHTQIAKAWGFTPVNFIIWDKDMMGMGAWLRNQTEHILFAKRGNVKPFHATTVRNIVRHSRKGLKHSEKPAVFNKMIEELTTESFRRVNGKKYKPTYCELFARRIYGNWVTVGNEIDGFDIRVKMNSIAQMIL